MNLFAKCCLAGWLLGLAGCAAENENVTTTRKSTTTSSNVDTTMLDRSRNSNMDPSSSNPMGAMPR